MNLSKRTIIALSSLGVSAALLVPAATMVHAASDNNRLFAPHENLIQALAERFGLNQDELETFFEEHHKEMRGKMEAETRTRIEERLTKDVEAGKITETQKQAILTKLDELHAQAPVELKGSEPGEMKERMEARKAELEAWAAEQKLDPSYLRGILGHGPQLFVKKGMGPGFGRMGKGKFIMHVSGPDAPPVEE